MWVTKIPFSKKGVCHHLNTFKQLSNSWKTSFDLSREIGTSIFHNEFVFCYFQLIRPVEMCNPKVDELSMMTYLSQFPNAKLKAGAPLRPKTNPNKVRAYGPGKSRFPVVKITWFLENSFIFTARSAWASEGNVFSLSVHGGGAGQAGYLSHNALQNLRTMWPHSPLPPPQEVGTPHTPPLPPPCTPLTPPAPYTPHPYPPSRTPPPCCTPAPHPAPWPCTPAPVPRPHPIPHPPAMPPLPQPPPCTPPCPPVPAPCPVPLPRTLPHKTPLCTRPAPPPPPIQFFFPKFSDMSRWGAQAVLLLRSRRRTVL